MLRSPTHIRGALLTGAVCVVWVLLAHRSPDLTYHFAPLIAAVVWPLSLRSAGVRARRDATIGAALAGTLTLGTALGLHFAGDLEGPTFWNDGPALIEAVLFAMAGALLGGRATSRTNPGLLGRLVESDPG